MSDSQGNSPRVIFVGDSGVGKTSIIHYMKFGSFDSHSLPTVGAGWTSMDCYFENKKIEYQLWDTAGQEIYRSLVPIYFKNAIGAIICFSLTDAISFQSLQSWVDQCLSYTANPVKI
ncbi:RAS, putative [Trichomonas vaginalis G3]|uniref:RAS, putative n=1 Tax=Trichomonas vaginalis (strain ATCC PRA-98 / G3) TaxID=412133 RepID=A2DNV2_TRIV3|nr:retrograde vesicle-mediated transport, Golgi to ER [Trichomonas vaginalis G3]EAY17947.1 RAS, putative [Trichomonas vaginalis G3]KAI5527129.1 retrograde vesicle-mediated transport, Golgi to ER [Trichomonas vaginalis G3]|eukprot:XP_001578933.1 RAS [Trichomonas vaginalis G3]